MMVQAAIVAANAAILLRGKVELVLLIAKEKKILDQHLLETCADNAGTDP